MPRHSISSGSKTAARPQIRGGKSVHPGAAQGAANRDERNDMISKAAYFRAEHRGFEGGDEVRDWLEAEADIDARFHH
jgi:hypothetical protein